MLELKNISVGYDGRYMIRKTDLSFESGKVYGVVGKNASGKSDLLKTCAGEQHPRTGTVKLDGRNLQSRSVSEIRQHISYLPEERRISNMRVGQFLAEQRKPKQNKTDGCALERPLFG